MNELEYFKNFQEGENITITIDFIEKAEKLERYIKMLEAEIKYLKTLEEGQTTIDDFLEE